MSIANPHRGRRVSHDDRTLLWPETEGATQAALAINVRRALKAG
jgi:hypothetical protein